MSLKFPQVGSQTLTLLPEISPKKETMGQRPAMALCSAGAPSNKMFCVKSSKGKPQAPKENTLKTQRKASGAVVCIAALQVLERKDFITTW